MARDPHDIEAERRELGFRRFTCLGLAAGNDETGAGSSEPLGHGAPDAPGPTGDDRGSAVEPEQLVDVDAHWSPDRFDPFVGSPLSMSAQWGLGRLLDVPCLTFRHPGNGPSVDAERVLGGWLELSVLLADCDDERLMLDCIVERATRMVDGPSSIRESRSASRSPASELTTCGYA